jgi:hypothetical protein
VIDGSNHAVTVGAHPLPARLLRRKKAGIPLR